MNKKIQTFDQMNIPVRQAPIQIFSDEQKRRNLGKFLHELLASTPQMLIQFINSIVAVI